MPILLDDLDFAPPPKPKSATPKFFSSEMTGTGGGRGLLSSSVKPSDTAEPTLCAIRDVETKQTSSQHDITTIQIPMAPVVARALRVEGDFTLPVPGADRRLDLTVGRPDWNVALNLTPQALVLYKDASGEKIKRDLVIQYRTELYLLRPGTDPERALLLSNASRASVMPDEAVVMVDWMTSPMDHAENFVSRVLTQAGVDLHIDSDVLRDWMTEYPVCERITDLAQVWDSEQIAEEVIAYVDGMATDPNDDQLNMLALQLRYLENYEVPLEAYHRIHARMAEIFPPEQLSTLAKQNLSLLMNHTLGHLQKIKPKLTTPPTPATPPQLPGHLSAEQRGAITTQAPLVMNQAGAGTGKTFTITQRIDWLRQCGVDLTDIMVLSFTNAAADTIVERYPQVGSMTIAAMIHDIYHLNHPTHQISSIETIMNSLRIFHPRDSVADRMATRLLHVKQNKTGAFTALNSFIESNFEKVVSMLDAIGQTSLELEIILCYQSIETMVEPPELACKYLIIDEVQDNSVFEFIYLLKYVSKHLQSLFIVGDASQTLYEFRSANPRALNTLEGSKVFETHKLSTNYRSNQEILDFANVVLGGLETNQIAGIRLQANSLEIPTKKSFEEKVSVDYRTTGKIKEFVDDELKPIIANTVIPEHVQACLDRGEQVAFLARSRRQVKLIQEVLEAKLPGKNVVSMVSDKTNPSDVISKYINFFWDEVRQAPPHNATYVVDQGIKTKLENLTRGGKNPKVAAAIHEMLSDWYLTNDATIKAWIGLYDQGNLTHQEFLDRLRDNLLSYEIQRNSIRDHVVQQRNREKKNENKAEDADLIVSTVHGVKGMEFDNVVVLYQEDDAMSQELRRLFYVAFTRAIKTLHVLAFGTKGDPPIVSNHQQIAGALEIREKKSALTAGGIDPETVDLSEIDVDDVLGSYYRSIQPVPA